MGDLKNPVAALMLLGFVLIIALNYRRVIGGTLIGILAVTVIGLPFGLAHYSGIVSLPPSITPTLLQLDFSRVFEGTFLIVVFSILFIDVFDNAGTLIGVTHRTGLMKDGKLARMKEALISDSFAAMFGSLIGTSTTTSYIESAAGVSAGGRTGLTAAFVVGLLPAGAAVRAARRHGAGLCHLGGAALCRLRDGARPCRNRLGRHHRIRAGGGDGDHHAADLFDRHRHRARLHHLRAGQGDIRKIQGSLAGGDRAGGAVRHQVRGVRMSAFSSWQTWAVLSAIFAALTAIFAKVGVENINSDLATFIRTIVVIVTLGFLLAVTGEFQAPGTISARTYLFLLLSGLGTGASWLCYFRALKLGEAAKVAPIDKLSVVLVAIFGVMFLGERLSAPNWLGVGLITAGALLVAYR